MSDEPDEIAEAPEKEATTTEAKRKPGRPGKARKLNVRDWLEIVQMARAGVPVAKIAETFHVAPPSIYAGLRSRNVKLGAYMPNSRQVEESAHRQELMKRIKDTKDMDYRYTEFIQRRVVKVLTDAEKDGKKVSAAYDEVKTLKAALDAVRVGTDNKWRILGLDKENDDADKELPELPIREMSELEITAERDKQLMDDSELESLEFAEVSDELEDGEDDEGGAD